MKTITTFVRQAVDEEQLLNSLKITLKHARSCGATMVMKLIYTDALELKLDDVVQVLAGPKRPQDRISS